jgi:hypothetical protein
MLYEPTKKPLPSSSKKFSFLAFFLLVFDNIFSYTPIYLKQRNIDGADSPSLPL